MRASFDAIAGRLIERSTDASDDLAGVAACVRVAEEFSRTLSTHPAQFRMTADEIVMNGTGPVGSTMLVCAPSCSAVVIAKHLAACLAAGNRVELVLFETPTAMLALLVTVVREVISPHTFAVVSEQTGWQMVGGNPTVVVLTETDAFMNDELGDWRRDLPPRTTALELIDFYSVSSTVRVTVGFDSR